MKHENSQLPHVAFCILLALSLKERHGYEIIKQVEDDSQGKTKLGPGSLYTSIKQLLGQGLISEVKVATDDRRRYYRLSAAGVRRLESEIDYYANAVAIAKRRQILSGMKHYA